MRASHDLAGCLPASTSRICCRALGCCRRLLLAQRIDVAGLVDERLTVARHGANSGTKAMTVIGSMLAGGDSIDDTALLRAGALPDLFDLSRAPSTVGSWLRDFRWHNVRQLDAVSRELLARLWAAGAGPADLSAPMTIDVDSTIVPVFGRGKQGAAFGYTKVRGYHPQLATLAETGQVLFCRLRGGAAGAARGAKSFLTETISRVRGSRRDRAVDGARGLSVLLQGRAAHGGEVRCPVLGHRPAGQEDPGRDRGDPRGGVDADPVLAARRPEVSGADVAETSYTAFAGTKHAMDVRLIVRRVRPTPGSQLALFTTFDYHAFVTDRAGDMLEIEADHRRHAIVEQSIAELKSAGLAHLPSSEVHGQCRLARPRRDRPQPRPRRRPARRRPPAQGHRRHPAPRDVHHARPARAQRPTTTPTTTRELALGRGIRHRPGRDHRDPAPPLTPTTTDHHDQGPRRSRQTGTTTLPSTSHHHTKINSQVD